MDRNEHAIKSGGLSFRVHLTLFLTASVVLMFTNFVQSPENMWFHWPMSLWGFFLMAHAAKSLMRLTQLTDA